MIKEIKKLSQFEVERLQKKIVDEHYHHTYESFSLHIYESRYKIEDKLYVFYKVLGEDHLEVYEYEEVEDVAVKPTQEQLIRFKEVARK